MQRRSRGRVALLLHAHLPFVRHPEHPTFLEERWFFEALTESYLPLLDMVEGLERDDVPARFTLSLSPTLLTMLTDPLLGERYRRHLDALVELSEREERRTRGAPEWHRCAVLYEKRLHRARTRFVERWGRDIVGALRAFQDRGRLEIATTAATHAVLPLLSPTPACVRAQIAVGMAEHRRHFGRSARGFWLPECAYHPGLEADLARAGIRWVVLDTHGVTHATPQPVYGVFAPVATAPGVAAYGRDFASATQVWSAESGYPGDPWYRDFHRDIGFDLSAEHLGPFAAGAARTPTGLKYHRVTGSGADKQPYDPARAAERIGVHAADFVAARRAQLAPLLHAMDQPPIVVCPYDAELFGHWWFEGLDWLDGVLRALARAPDIEAVSLSDDLDRRSALQLAAPAASSWGWRGHHAMWLSPANDWIYPQLHAAGDRLVRLGGALQPGDTTGRRALVHALRELLLAQASDWAFMMARGTATAYATRRTAEHLLGCRMLCDGVERGTHDDAVLAALEARDPIFPVLDVDVLA